MDAAPLFATLQLPIHCDDGRVLIVERDTYLPMPYPGLHLHGDVLIEGRGSPPTLIVRSVSLSLADCSVRVLLSGRDFPRFATVEGAMAACVGTRTGWRVGDMMPADEWGGEGVESGRPISGHVERAL